MRNSDHRKWQGLDNAVVLAEGVFGSTYGKTANGLVRYSRRYRITSVIDSRYSGKDAGQILSGKPNGVPIISSLKDALTGGANTIIVGVATDGGFLPAAFRPFISDALKAGMNVVSGLHEFLSDDREFAPLAAKTGAVITDVRKMFRDMKNPFTGEIENVRATRIAVLGTDSAIGKRTTSVFLNEAMNRIGRKSIMIGTGQTAWMQGFKYTVVTDAMINDFISGNLESITVRAWNEEKPDFMFIEGQGSIIHPAYAGSFEILGACRPKYVVLQHAPRRLFFDGFEQFRIPELSRYIKAIELLADTKVIAISINGEGMKGEEISESINKTHQETGLPAFDPLSDLTDVAEYISGLDGS